VFASLTPQNKPHAKNGYAIFGFAHPPPNREYIREKQENRPSRNKKRNTDFLVD